MIYIILITIAALSKAFMDNLKDDIDFGKNLWFKGLSWSWVLKYKNSNDLKPRFFGATTFLVWLTDFWHFAQMVFLMALFSFLILPPLPIFETIFVFVLFLILFELFFRVLRRKALNKTDIFISAGVLLLIGGLGLNYNLLDSMIIWQIFVISSLFLFVFLFLEGIFIAIKKR